MAAHYSPPDAERSTHAHLLLRGQPVAAGAPQQLSLAPPLLPSATLFARRRQPRLDAAADRALPQARRPDVNRPDTRAGLPSGAPISRSLAHSLSRSRALPPAPYLSCTPALSRSRSLSLRIACSLYGLFAHFLQGLRTQEAHYRGARRRGLRPLPLPICWGIRPGMSAPRTHCTPRRRAAGSSAAPVTARRTPGGRMWWSTCFWSRKPSAHTG